MAHASYVQTSFAGGEWSQAAQGQSVRPDYRTAMNTCLNGLPTDAAAWTRRPGFRQAGFTRGGAAGRLIPFFFKESQPYNMEFTDGHIRFWNGPNLVTTNDNQTISSISSAGVVTTALAHGWSTGDQVIFPSLGATALLLQQRVCTITVLTTTTFSMVDAVTGAAISGASLTDAAGTVARVKDIATSYTASAWANLRSVQAEKQAVFLNGASPQVLQLVTNPGASAFATFSLAAANFRDGPYLDPFKDSLATPSALIGNISLTFSFTAYDATKSYSIGDYVSNLGHNYKSLLGANLGNTPAGAPTYWQEVSGGDPVSSTGFVAGDIGRHIRMYSEPALWVAGTTYAAKDVVAYNNLYWQSIAGTNTGNVPGLDVTKWQLRTGSSFALWTWGRITAVSGSGIISGVLAGSANIGGMTAGGGLAAAFDGTTAKSASGSAESAAVSGGAASITSYVGKNYSGASDQTIASVTAYPSTDKGFAVGTNNTGPITVVLNLRAKASAPASSSDGTLLGTSGAFANSFAAVSIASNDTSTAWKYVWIEAIITVASGAISQNVIAQVVFFTPNVANGSVVTLQVAGPALLYTSAIRIWRAGLYSDAAGWPKSGTFHEGRLWLSGHTDNRVDSSMAAGDIFNFAPTEDDGTVTDASGISYIFNLPDVNPVFWMEPDEQGIICGTQGGEVLIDNAGGVGPISPTSIRARRRTQVKCANILPRKCDHTIVFVQKNQRRLQEYFADIYSGKFQSPNLSYLAKHLAATGLQEIAFQQDLVPVVWGRTGDGSLVGMAYKRDSNISSQAPVLMGWHGHTHGASRTFESIVVGPSVNGDLETLSAVTSDGTYRYVEMLGDIFEETDGFTDAGFVDGHIIPASYAVSTNGASLNLYGLHGLNGKTVSVWAAGLDGGDVTVANGTAAVSFGDGVGAGAGDGLFTADLVASYGAGLCPIRVGFTYTSKGQIVRPAAAEQTGARQGPGFMKTRRSHWIGAQLVKTRGISLGTDFAKLRPAKLMSNGGRVPLTAQQPFSGIHRMTMDDDFSLDSMLCWQVSRPYPAIVTSMGAFIETQDQ